MTAELLAVCERRQLSAWEHAFLADIRRRQRPLTPKQRALLERIAEGPPDFPAINAAARRRLPDLLARWLPDDKTFYGEYSARNPRRSDQHPGSFKVNVTTGAWSDFATGDKGGDPVSLAAYLFDLPQHDAAQRLAVALGLATEKPHG